MLAAIRRRKHAPFSRTWWREKKEGASGQLSRRDKKRGLHLLAESAPGGGATAGGRSFQGDAMVTRTRAACFPVIVQRTARWVNGLARQSDAADRKRRAAVDVTSSRRAEIGIDAGASSRFTRV